MYVHWMVKDVPANNIKNGVEVMQYVTPFSLEFNEAGELITDAAESSHPLIMAVFKQKAGKIVVEEAQQGCGPDIGPEGPRIVDYRDLLTKYNLELVAGNYLYMPYSGYATHAMICRLSKCLREQWPFPMPGINDLEECQPRKDIVDATTRGPIKGKEAQYNKYASEFSSDSITNLVKVRRLTWSHFRVERLHIITPRKHTQFSPLGKDRSTELSRELSMDLL